MNLIIVRLESHKVIKACEQWLERRNVWRDNLKGEMILAVMSGWFAPKTRNAALKKLEKKHSPIMPWQHNNYWDDEISNLIKAANVSISCGDAFVTINAELAGLIQGYLK